MLKEDFKVIREAFLFYDEQLNSHEFTYTYHNKKTNKKDEFVVLFRKDNFMHLCGIEYWHINNKGEKKRKIPAKKFYSDLKKERINLNQLFTKEDGSTQQKLQVLPSLSLLIKKGVRVTGAGTFYHMKFDKSVRTGKNIVGLTCVSSRSKYAPQSIINLTSGSKAQSKAFKDSHKVVKLEKRNLQTNEKTLLIEE